MNKPQLNLQDIFLNQVRKENIGVTIYLVNSVQLRGMVRGFDAFTITPRIPSAGLPSSFTSTPSRPSFPPAPCPTSTRISNEKDRDNARRWPRLSSRQSRGPSRPFRPRPKSKAASRVQAGARAGASGVKFTKMHGIGNDFVMIDCLKSQPSEESLPALSRKLNDRRFGIGGDGIILVLPSRLADLRMRMFNPDGSEAEMCGNGIRCFAKYAYERKLIDETQLKVETAAGVKSLKLLTRGGKVDGVRVDMGHPRLKRSEIPMKGDEAEKVVNEPLKVDGRRFDITAVSMGNPHVVIFEENVKAFDLERYGPIIEHHRSFPQRTNVHFVQVCSPSEIIIRTGSAGRESRWRAGPARARRSSPPRSTIRRVETFASISPAATSRSNGPATTVSS